MAIETYAIKCPECGASIQLPEGLTKGYCNYCGAQIAVENTNEHVTRHIDEAKLKRAETEALVRLKELEMEQQRIEREERGKRFKAIAAVLLVVLAMVCFLAQIFMPAEKSLYMLMTGMMAFLILLLLIAGNHNNQDDK